MSLAFGECGRLREATHTLKVQRATLGSASVSDERSASAVDRKLGERVRARRLEIGMSQERLAELLGVTFQQVQKYEKGINRMAASRLYDMSAALDMPMTRFFEGISAARRGAKVEMHLEDLFAQPGAADLLRLYASVKNEKVRRRMLDLMRAMADEQA